MRDPIKIEKTGTGVILEMTPYFLGRLAVDVARTVSQEIDRHRRLLATLQEPWWALLGNFPYWASETHRELWSRGQFLKDVSLGWLNNPELYRPELKELVAIRNALVALEEWKNLLFDMVSKLSTATALSYLPEANSTNYSEHILRLVPREEASTS